MTRVDFALSPEQKADARRALKILDGAGSLEQAATAFVTGKRSINRLPISDVADKFLRTRLALRPATVAWYDERLKYVVDKFGDRIMDQVTRANFREWLSSSPWAPASRAGIARAARALWRWAMHQEPPIAAVNVTEGVEFAVTTKREGGSQKVLSVEECRAIMQNIGPIHRSAAALMLFAGIRPDELAGKGKTWLPWSVVNVAESIIRIPTECAKIGEARVIEGLPEAVWRWVTPQDRGTVATVQRRTLVAHVKAAGEFGVERPWKQDALRHTFASYAVAMFNDPGRVAMWLGHNGNPTMLHRHYRGLVTKAEAEKFWALRPN